MGLQANAIGYGHRVKRASFMQMPDDLQYVHAGFFQPNYRGERLTHYVYLMNAGCC